MNELTEKEFQNQYNEITGKLLFNYKDQKELDFLYDRMVTLIKYAVDRAEYQENIRQKNASASNTLMGLAFTGLGLVWSIVTGPNWMDHPATYLLIPPLLVLLGGGVIAAIRHEFDSRFEYPHQGRIWIEERWYFKKSIPAFEDLLEKKGTDTPMRAFLKDLKKEFNRDPVIDKLKEISKDKETLVILYIVTAYKKMFANRISKYHSWSFSLAGLVMLISALYYYFVMPFIP